MKPLLVLAISCLCLSCACDVDDRDDARDRKENSETEQRRKSITDSLSYKKWILYNILLFWILTYKLLKFKSDINNLYWLLISIKYYYSIKNIQY